MLTEYVFCLNKEIEEPSVSAGPNSNFLLTSKIKGYCQGMFDLWGQAFLSPSISYVALVVF